ncbi:MAG TPA: hypothetical protein VF311_05515 [Terriglobales bacterium]|jgi:hypothetical protein
MQRRKMLSVGPVLAIVAGVILSFAPMATAQSDNSANQIEGTWRVQITFVNCDTGAPTGQVAQGMNTFIHGGTMVGTPSAPSVVIRNGNGVWVHTGGQSYLNRLVFFTYSGAGAPTGRQETLRRIELGPGPDEYTSADVVTFVDPAGNKTAGPCVSGHGTRMKVDED